MLYEIPGSCIRIAFTKPDAQPRSQEYLEAGKTDKAHDAICYAAKIMAGTFCDVITTPGLLTQIKEEFYAAKQKE